MTQNKSLLRETSRLLAPRVSLSEQVRTVSDSELVGRHVAF